MITFPVGHTFKNYTDVCRQLNQPIQQGGRNRKRQEAYWAEHFIFTKQGHKYIICQMLKPFPIKSLPPKPEDKRVAMHLKPLILHELTETLLKRGTTTYYKLAREFVLPRSDAYVMFGLASPLWKEMKGGDAHLDLTSTEQRKAYFEHRAVCYDKLQSAIDSLVQAKLIWQDKVVIVKEQIAVPDQTAADGTLIPAHHETIVRYARTEEESDFRDVDVKTYMALNARYPERKKPFSSIADVWLSHKEEEYNFLHRQLIETEINDKAVINLPSGFTKIIAFFPAMRLAFDPEVLQKAFTQLSEAEIYKEQQSIKRKLISWYEVRFESEKSLDVQCCLYDIVGDIEHE